MNSADESTLFHPADRVLVAVMTNRRDFQLARDEGWYRIPARHAPPSTTEAVVLAFYFTKAFGEEKWAVRWYAPVRGHELVRRRELFPDQPQHPRADEVYYRLALGPLIALERPIPSLRWRRISFIETSWDRFAAAEEINDLYASGADGLYVTLKEAGLFPEREFVLREGRARIIAELAIPCEDGVVAIAAGTRVGPPGALCALDLESVRRAVERLGGVSPPNRAAVDGLRPRGRG